MMQRRVVYLLANTIPEGVRFANDKGWERIASMRWASDDNMDVRLVTRANELLGAGLGQLPLMRTREWDDNANVNPTASEVEGLIEAGHAYWVDP